VAGAFSFQLAIVNNDSDEGDYDILVSGTGCPTLTVSVVDASGTDNVSSSSGTPTPGPIDCPGGGACVVQFLPAESVTLNVSVDAGSSFQGWSGDCAALGAALSGAITMDDCKACTATFVPQPDVAVERPAGTPIPDGGTDVVGNQAPTTVHLSYTVDNSGGAVLTIPAGGVTADNLVNAAGFGVPEGQLPLTVAAGESGPLLLQFDVSALGAFSLDLHIDSDDPDERPYDIQVAGTGAAVPEIDVRGNDLSIFDGDATPSLTDHTDFGLVGIAGRTSARVYTVRNTGLAALSLTGGPTRVAIGGGAHAGDFSLVGDASTSVAAGASSAFTIVFDPTAVGNREATVTIDTNDGDEDPFTFSIRGTGLVGTGGDVNADGATDLLDVRLCHQIAVGAIDPTPAEFGAADVDGDGVVDIDDVQWLAGFVAGTRTSFP